MQLASDLLGVDLAGMFQRLAGGNGKSDDDSLESTPQITTMPAGEPANDRRRTSGASSRWNAA